MTAADKDKSSLARRELKRAFYVFPSGLTLVALFAGFLSVSWSFAGDLEAAGWAIIVAAFLDMTDGRIARLLQAESEFGAQLDSLSDVICFGLAPAVLALEWGLNDLGRAGLTAGYFFCACAAVRLARFNVSKGASDPRYFTGLPSPVAGVMVAAATLSFTEATLPVVLLVTVMLFILAVTMVIDVRHYSFKKLDLPNILTTPLTVLMALGTVCVVAYLLLEFQATGILVLGAAYVGVAYARAIRAVRRRYRKFRADGGGGMPQFLRQAWRSWLGDQHQD